MSNLMTIPDMVAGVSSECISLVESHNSTDWQAEANYAIQLLCNNDWAAKIAQQNPVSVQNALRNAASIGISLNPASKHAYLIPRKINKQQQICLDVSYMGLLHLAMSTGSIKWGRAELVYSSDSFTLNGIDQAPTHNRDPFTKDRGEIAGAYCTVKTADDDYLTECMSVGEINSIRGRSESYKRLKNGVHSPSGPWVTDYTEMCRKTVVKRASKYWPKVDRLDNAINVLNNESGEGISDKAEVERDITPASSNVISEIASIVEGKGRTVAQFIQYMNSRTGQNFSSLEQFTEQELKEIGLKALEVQK